MHRHVVLQDSRAHQVITVVALRALVIMLNAKVAINVCRTKANTTLHSQPITH